MIYENDMTNFRNKMLIHAVHMAILLHINSALILVDDIGHSIRWFHLKSPISSYINI